MILMMIMMMIVIIDRLWLLLNKLRQTTQLTMLLLWRGKLRRKDCLAPRLRLFHPTTWCLPWDQSSSSVLLSRFLASKVCYILLSSWSGLRGDRHDAESFVWSSEAEVWRKNHHHSSICWHITRQEERSQQSLQESSDWTLKLPRLKPSWSSEWNRKNFWAF